MGRELMAFRESRNDQREAVAEALVAAADAPPYRSSGARESIEAQLARVWQRFEWGAITADEYRDKREWLLAQRAEVDRPAAQPISISRKVRDWSYAATTSTPPARIRASMAS